MIVLARLFPDSTLRRTRTSWVTFTGRRGEICTSAPSALSVDTLSSTTTREESSTSRPMVLSCATLWSTSTSLHWPTYTPES